MLTKADVCSITLTAKHAVSLPFDCFPKSTIEFYELITLIENKLVGECAITLAEWLMPSYPLESDDPVIVGDASYPDSVMLQSDLSLMPTDEHMAQVLDFRKVNL